MNHSSIQEAMIYGSGIERQFCCHVHGEKNASASVNALSGLWYCYACGAKGKYNVEDMPMPEFAAMVRSIIDKLDAEEVTHPESWLDIYDSLGPGDYWLSRFTPETCRTHRLGHDAVQQYATIPVRDQSGTVLGVIRRDLTGRDPAKYRYPWGVNISTLLFNYHRCEGDVLMLTEGATDAMAAEEAGVRDVMATYRNGLSKAQVALIAKYDPKVVLVAYDQDDAGNRGAEQVTKALQGVTRVDRLWWDPAFKDLASIPLSERSDMLQEVSEKTCV